MADLSDVESVLVAILTQIIYPTGTGNPSIMGVDCFRSRGWPTPTELDQNLAAGKITVTVFPMDNESNITRYPRDWQDLPVTVPNLTLTVGGSTITVGGTVSSPLNVAALVDGSAYVYAVQHNDTPTSIATALAALINANTAASSSGPVITVSGAKTPLVARVGAVGSVVRETKRQKRGFQITFWCPTPALRDAIVPPCDAALAALSYVTLPDGTAGRIRYQRSMVSNRAEKQALYRRDLVYSVEYGTTETMTAPQVLTQRINLSGGLDPSAPPIKTLSL